MLMLYLDNQCDILPTIKAHTRFTLADIIECVGGYLD